MAMASDFRMLLPAPQPIPISARAHLTPPHFHSRRLALRPPRPAALSTITSPAATRPRKRGSPHLLRAAACCNGSTAAAGSGGVAKGWQVFFAWYLMALDKNPIATKVITSAVLTLAGDLICQVVVDQVPELNLKRTFVFTFLGLTLVGPTLHVRYLYLSKLVAITGASGAIARLLLDQFIFSPIFIGVFMSLLVTLEGNPSLVVQKLKQVLAVNFVALPWNVILSFKAHKEIVVK